MIFAAVKLDCFHASSTEVKVTSDRSVLQLGPEWLVYQVRLGRKGILMPYNHDTGRHELKPSASQVESSHDAHDTTHDTH